MRKIQELDCQILRVLHCVLIGIFQGLEKRTRLFFNCTTVVVSVEKFVFFASSLFFFSWKKYSGAK